jgi:thiamine kinase-like enzyme
MAALRRFHQLGLQVDHDFDLFRQLEFYEALWQGTPSAYGDYATTKAHVWSLRPYITSQPRERVLCHIDSVPDNFLFYPDGQGGEALRLIDWEYAGMQDPHVDLAMFCIYALYDRAQVDHLLDLYFAGACPQETRLKIYCYIAVCGLLWSNWCEYKHQLGVEFGEYSLRQYRYAKDYYRLVREVLPWIGDEPSCTR